MSAVKVPRGRLSFSSLVAAAAADASSSPPSAAVAAGADAPPFLPPFLPFLDPPKPPHDSSSWSAFFLSATAPLGSSESTLRISSLGTLATSGRANRLADDDDEPEAEAAPMRCWKKRIKVRQSSISRSKAGACASSRSCSLISARFESSCALRSARRRSSRLARSSLSFWSAGGRACGRERGQLRGSACMVQVQRGSGEGRRTVLVVGLAESGGRRLLAAEEVVELLRDCAQERGSFSVARRYSKNMRGK